MKFPKNNKILYSREFGNRRGIPSKVDFKVKVLSTSRFKLTAPGYGETGTKGNYGNGPIYISTSNLELVQELTEASKCCP